MESAESAGARLANAHFIMQSSQQFFTINLPSVHLADAGRDRS